MRFVLQNFHGRGATRKMLKGITRIQVMWAKKKTFESCRKIPAQFLPVHIPQLLVFCGEKNLRSVNIKIPLGCELKQRLNPIFSCGITSILLREQHSHVR